VTTGPVHRDDFRLGAESLSLISTSRDIIGISGSIDLRRRFVGNN
jgi:hypothetical protein